MNILQAGLDAQAASIGKGPLVQEFKEECWSCKGTRVGYDERRCTTCGGTGFALVRRLAKPTTKPEVSP